MRLLTQEVMARLFTVTDEIPIDREELTVPLAMEGEGDVRRLPGGRLEIVLPDRDDLESFLAALPERIAAI